MRFVVAAVNHIPKMFFKLPTFLSCRQLLVPKVIKSHLLKCSCYTALPEESLKKIKYFLILDFEATCDRSRKYEQEIIEFPCLKVNANTMIEESRFHRYVRPTINPILTEFCIELTGILQEMVDSEKTFPEVYQAFEEWREKENLTEENSLYITSGDWDFGRMMPKQCGHCNLEIPSHMYIWSDIKKVFADSTGHYKNTLKEIMDYYKLQHIGRIHSGLDDCLNLKNVVECMVQSKAAVYPTSKLFIVEDKRKVERLKLLPKEPLAHLFMKE